MVGDGSYLSPNEAAPLIWPDGVSRTTLRDYFDKGLLRGRIRGQKHRQIEAASVVELNEVLKLPPGADRESGLRNLIESNMKLRERPKG